MPHLYILRAPSLHLVTKRSLCILMLLMSLRSPMSYMSMVFDLFVYLLSSVYLCEAEEAAYSVHQGYAFSNITTSILVSHPI